IRSVPPFSTPAVICLSTAASAATPHSSRFRPVILCKCSSSSAGLNQAPLLERLAIPDIFHSVLTKASRELGLQDSLSLRPPVEFQVQPVSAPPKKTAGKGGRGF